MPCWVVPTVAADIWGVSLDHVLECIRAGQIVSKKEDGFVFVDVAPDGRRIARAAQESDRPPTYTVITKAEMQALHGEDEDDGDGDMIESNDSTETPTTLSWKSVRLAAGRQRRAPASLP